MQRRNASSIFFFQAEDGIRDVAVTGVQTCALPILDLAALFIVDHRVDPGHARAGAAGLHGVERRLCAAEEPAVFRLPPGIGDDRLALADGDRKSTRLNSSHGYISYAVFCLKKKKTVIISRI